MGKFSSMIELQTVRFKKNTNAKVFSPGLLQQTALQKPSQEIAESF